MSSSTKLQKRWGPQKAQKHYCKVCRTFIQPDARSIQRHETGNRHKNNLLRQQKAREACKLLQDRQQAAADRELARLDEIVGSSTPHVRQTRTPDLGIAPSRTSKGDGMEELRTRAEERVKEYLEEDEEEYDVFPDEVLGQYSINGVVYLDGRFHEDLLKPAMNCEAVRLTDAGGEMEEMWEKARITFVQVRHELRRGLKRLCHDYTVKFDADGAIERKRSNDIRVVAPKLANQEIHENEAGVGWSTVSVRYIEVGEDAGPNLKEESGTTSTATHLGHVDEENGADDAYAAFNPFGGKYKGVDLESKPVVGDEYSSGAAVARSSPPRIGNITFKKRKKKRT